MKTTLFAILLFGLMIAGASAAELTKVTIVLSTSDQDVSYQPYGPYAQQMGWYKDAGLDVVIQTAPTTGQVIQLVLSGNAQFGQVTPDALLLTAQTQPLPMKIVYAMARKQIWAAAVAPGSPVHSFGDLKGKVIGYPSESPAIAAFVDARMHDDGASQADTTSVATGYGVTSMEALKSGRIDAFIAWPGLFASFQNAGYQFTVLPDADWQKGYYGIGQGATNDYIAQHPDIVAKIGRGIAMSAVVLKTHPEEMVRAFWKAYPARAPLPGDDEALAMKKELNILRATAGQMRIDELPADFAWGSQDDATWQRHMDNLLKIGLATKRLDPANYFTNAFTPRFKASFKVSAGEFVSLVGPSGCGKSTLLRMIAGLIDPTLGVVLLGSRPVSEPSAEIGIAFQRPVLLPWLTVRGNIALPAELEGRLGKQQIAARVDALLKMVRLTGSGDRMPGELSGGMQQRVAIARALMTDPGVLLMDEPFGALDALTREHLNDELLDIWARSQPTVIFVTHDIPEAVYLSDRVLVMAAHPGRVIADIAVTLPRPRDAQTRVHPDFARLGAEIRMLIGH